MVVLAGCSHGATRQASSTTSPPSTAPTTTAPSSGATTTSTAAASTALTPTSATSTGRCHTTGLALSLGNLGAAAGTQYLALVFRNTTARACTMQGYPGVSFVNAGGTQIGAAVQRVSDASVVVTLAPGATAGAQMLYHDAYVSTVPACQPATAAGIRAYPPEETASLVVPTNLVVCANPAASGTAGVQPVTTPAKLNP